MGGVAADGMEKKIRIEKKKKKKKKKQKFKNFATAFNLSH